MSAAKYTPSPPDIRNVPIRKHYGTFIGGNLSEERFSLN